MLAAAWWSFGWIRASSSATHTHDWCRRTTSSEEEVKEEGDHGGRRPSKRLEGVCTHLTMNNAQQRLIRLDALRRTALDRIDPGGRSGPHCGVGPPGALAPPPGSPHVSAVERTDLHRHGLAGGVARGPKPPSHQAHAVLPEPALPRLPNERRASPHPLGEKLRSFGTLLQVAAVNGSELWEELRTAMGNLKPGS
jgi:hypothetical protein